MIKFVFSDEEEAVNPLDSLGHYRQMEVSHFYIRKLLVFAVFGTACLAAYTTLIYKRVAPDSIKSSIEVVTGNTLSEIRDGNTFNSSTNNNNGYDSNDVPSSKGYSGLSIKDVDDNINLINSTSSNNERHSESDNLTKGSQDEPSGGGPQGFVCTGTETRHLAFVKVHKAGSTTVMNILQRFAYVRDLQLALPITANILRANFSNLVPLPPNSTFDMLITHVDHYDRSLYEKVLPTDSKYIGIVREPLELSISAFEFYHRKYNLYRDVPGNEDSLKVYLNDRERYEPKDIRFSYTNNRMSYDFGLHQRFFHNPEAIKDFLERLHSEMDLVLVLEKFPESLVLLKRMLCWQLKDIIYITANKNYNKSSVVFTAQELEYHRNFSLADNELYTYFSRRLEERILAQDADFPEEVSVFKVMLSNLYTFCTAAKQGNFTRTNASQLIVPKTKFNEQFEVGVKDCELMMLKELAFVELSRTKQLLAKPS